MSTKKDLIQLGYQHPRLRPRLRRILSALDKIATTAMITALESWGQSKLKEYPKGRKWPSHYKKSRAYWDKYAALYKVVLTAKSRGETAEYYIPPDYQSWEGDIIDVQGNALLECVAVRLTKSGRFAPDNTAVECLFQEVPQGPDLSDLRRRTKWDDSFIT